LIDFDLLHTFDKKIEKLKDISANLHIAYRIQCGISWPIEWLVIGNILSKRPLSDHDLVTLYTTSEILELYTITHTHINSQETEELQAKQHLEDVLDNITADLKSNINNKLKLHQIIYGFDTFGLGFVFSYFLYYLQRNAAFKRNKTVTSMHRKLLDEAFNVAKSMCNFNILQRSTTTDSLRVMADILGRAGIRPASGGRRQTRRR
jgi:hypothetical protein